MYKYFKHIKTMYQTMNMIKLNVDRLFLNIYIYIYLFKLKYIHM